MADERECDDVAFLTPGQPEFRIDADARWRAVELARSVLSGGGMSAAEARLLAACHLFQYQRMAAIHQIAEGRFARRDGDPGVTVTVKVRGSGDGGEA